MELNHLDENQKKLLKLDCVLSEYKKRMGERLEETRKIFRYDVLIGDIHTHSWHSDGCCSVGEVKKYADLANMDFLFVTDHDSLNQAADCGKFGTVWCGQEADCGCHHIGLLSPMSLFVPAKNNFSEDWETAKRISPFVCVFHPTGWPPEKYYTEQQIARLFTIGPVFAMEILNGFFKVTDVFDQWQANNVKLWDELLKGGKRVAALGGSDAHFAAGVGCVWTGIFKASCDISSVINALNSGHTIASEGPILGLFADSAIVGDIVNIEAPERVILRIRAADSLGINSVTLIKDGQVREVFNANGVTLFDREFVDRYDSDHSWYRLECVSIDNKHGFTSPIYMINQ